MPPKKILPIRTPATGSGPAPSSQPEIAVLGGRKKRYAPKVRTGCLTCRKRRVKCDETKPLCLKCTTLGYKCDGYATLKTWLFEPGEKDSSFSPEKNEVPVKEENEPSQVALTTVAASPARSPFTQDEARSMQFYLRRTGNMVAKYDLSRFQFWTVIIPQAAHQFESLKHVLVATALQDEQITAPTTIANIDRRIDYHYQQSLEKLVMKMEIGNKSNKPPILNVLLNCMAIFYLESLRGSAQNVVKHLDAAKKIIDEWREKGEAGTPSARLLINVIDEILLESRIYTRCMPVPALEDKLDWQKRPAPTPYESDEDAQHALIACMVNCCKPTGQFPYALVRANAVLDSWTEDYQAAIRPNTKESAEKADDLKRLCNVARKLIELLHDDSRMRFVDRFDGALKAMASLPDRQLKSIQYRKPLTAVLLVFNQRAQTPDQLIRVAELERLLLPPTTG